MIIQMLILIILFLLYYFIISNIIFPIATLSKRDNQKFSKRLSKGSERSVYWNKYKTKSDNKKKRQVNLDISSNKMLLESIACFSLYKSW